MVYVRIASFFFMMPVRYLYVGTYCTVYVYIPVSSYLYRCNIYMYVRYIAAGSLAVTKMVSSPFDSVPFYPQTYKRDGSILLKRDLASSS